MAKLFRVFIHPNARAAFGGKKRLARRFRDDAAGEIWQTKTLTRIKAILAGGDLASVGVTKSETFRRASAGWIDQLAVRPATMAWYKLYLRRRLNPAFGDLKLTAIGQATLSTYRSRRRGEKAGTRTIEAELAVAQRVIRWARSAGYAVDETAFRVEAPEVRPEKTRHYDPLTVDQLLGAARRGPEPSKARRGRKTPEALAAVAERDVVAIEILRRTGLRAGELRAMSVSWIRWDERRIEIPHDESYSPKGGRTRSIPLETELGEILKIWLGDRKEGRVLEPITPGRRRGQGHFRGTGLDVQKLVGRVATAAGVDLTAHDLRHYAISRWVELMPAAGYSLADIQEWAGHASIRTTELYTHTDGARWRSHASGLDRAASGSDSGSDSGSVAPDEPRA